MMSIRPFQSSPCSEARRRIAPHVRRTPLVRSAWLSRATGADVWLKLENQQRTNAFKVRGASTPPCASPKRGERPALVTASAGNHGRALAEAAAATGMSCIVFTPSDAPRTKLDAIEAAGARLDASSRNYDAAEIAAKDYAASTGACFISPYTHPDVIAGGGTVAVEMIEDQPRLDVVVVPMGGGGLNQRHRRGTLGDGAGLPADRGRSRGERGVRDGAAPRPHRHDRSAAHHR